MPEKIDPERFQELLQAAQRTAESRWAIYQQLAGLMIPRPEADEVPSDA